MSIKSKVLAAAATLTLLSGVGAAGTLATATAANAATPSCGASCIDVFSRDFGTFASPNFVMDVFRQGARIGQPIILFRVANSDPAEDFIPSFQGTVALAAAAGLVNPQIAFRFADDPAFEYEYAPFGVASGLCVGVASTAFPGEGVTLQPCGVGGKTIWIWDVGVNADDPDALADGYFPQINGSDTNFTHPFVLTYPKFGFPTDIPRPQLFVTNLTGFSNGSGPVVGSVSSNQLYSFVTGVLP
jgi:hypothetical protein